MTEFIILAFCIVLGFVLGWRARELHAQRIVNNYLKAELEKQEKAPQNTLNIEVEKNNNCFYVYNTESGAFITQVKTKEELFDFFKSKHPDKNVMMKKEHFALFENV